MHFCSKCDNMYYIKLDEENNNNLIYYCRNCGNEDKFLDSKNMCVLDINLKQSERNYSNTINEFTKFDPTLPNITNIKCPNLDCPSNVSVTFENEAEESAIKTPSVKNDIIYIRYDDDNMKYVYLCKNCNNSWKTNTIN